MRYKVGDRVRLKVDRSDLNLPANSVGVVNEVDELEKSYDVIFSGKIYTISASEIL